MSRLDMHIVCAYIILPSGTCPPMPLVPDDKETLVERMRSNSLLIIVSIKERPKDLTQGEILYGAVVQVSLGHGSRCKM
jgi:hypothetical protein